MQYCKIVILLCCVILVVIAVVGRRNWLIKKSQVCRLGGRGSFRQAEQRVAEWGVHIITTPGSRSDYSGGKWSPLLSLSQFKWFSASFTPELCGQYECWRSCRVWIASLKTAFSVRIYRNFHFAHSNFFICFIFILLNVFRLNYLFIIISLFIFLPFIPSLLFIVFTS